MSRTVMRVAQTAGRVQPTPIENRRPIPARPAGTLNGGCACSPDDENAKRLIGPIMSVIGCLHRDPGNGVRGSRMAVKTVVQMVATAHRLSDRDVKFLTRIFNAE